MLDTLLKAGASGGGGGGGGGGRDGLVAEVTKGVLGRVPANFDEEKALLKFPVRWVVSVSGVRIVGLWESRVLEVGY